MTKICIHLSKYVCIRMKSYKMCMVYYFFLFL